jgi:NADH-quinone oxidoreductase subunit N
VGTIIITTVLGLLGMVMDILKMRKAIVILSSIVLIGLSVFNVVVYWGIDSTYYSGMLALNNFTVAFSSLLLLVSGLLIFLSNQFFKREAEKISDYVALFIFALVGALLMISYGNLAILFIGIEIMSISLYVLAASNRKSLASNEAGMKYFLMGAFMTGFLLMGITLIYGVTGSFDIYEIQVSIINHISTPILITGIMFLVIAMLFKASVAPFHFWAPDVYTGSPTLVTAFMSTVAKVAAFAAIYKLFSVLFISKMLEIEPIIVMFIILTFIIANFSALKQTSVKRILAFSGVSHAGFLLLAVVSSNYESAGNLFYYAAAYTIANVIAFTVVIYVSHVKENDHLDSFKGLLYARPALAIVMIISLFSLAGIPPLAGFIGKFLVLMATIKAQYTYVAIIAIFTSIVSIYYYFKIIISMSHKVDDSSHFVSPPVIYTIIAWIGVILLLILGFAPKYFVGLF